MARQDPRREKRGRAAFRLPVSLLNRLRSYAAKNGLVITSVVEDCVSEGLAVREKRRTTDKAAPSVNSFG